MTAKCQCKTLKGVRCSRNGKDNGYCYQHQKCINPVKKTKVEKKPKKVIEKKSKKVIEKKPKKTVEKKVEKKSIEKKPKKVIEKKVKKTVEKKVEKKSIEKKPKKTVEKKVEKKSKKTIEKKPKKTIEKKPKKAVEKKPKKTSQYINLPSEVKGLICRQLDIDDIIQCCSTDKKSMNTCSSYDFWSTVFERYKLPRPQELKEPRSFSDWVILFAKEMFDDRHILPPSKYLYSIAILKALEQASEGAKFVYKTSANPPISRVIIKKYISAYHDIDSNSTVLKEAFDNLIQDKVIISSKENAQSYTLSKKGIDRLSKL